MKTVPLGICIIFSALSSQCFALAFALQDIPLDHPANGDVMPLLPGYIAVSGHSAQNRWLSLVSLGRSAPPERAAEASSKVVKRVKIPPQAQYFGKMKLAGVANEQLVFFTTAGVSRYYPATEQLTSLVTSSSIYPLVDSKRLRLSEDYVLDINQSGLSDLLIPDFHVYHLWVQQPDGSFIHYPLSVNAQMETHEEGPQFMPRKAYLNDINLDGKTDISFVRDGKLLTFMQNADGSFPKEPAQRDPGMAISRDNEANLRAGDGRSFEGLTIRRVHDFTDLDGDGLADLIIRQENFSDALEQNYDYAIYYGHKTSTGLAFAQKPEAHINTRGIQFDSVFADINGDGRKDFYTPSASFGIGTVVRALISGSAGIELQFYLMDKERRFASEPDRTHKATANVSISGGRVDFPLLQLTNINGGRNKDLLLGEKQQRLVIYQSSNEELFSADKTLFNVDLPRDGTKVKLVDINHDGKDDIVLPFDAQEEDKTLRNRVRFLIMK